MNPIKQILGEEQKKKVSYRGYIEQVKARLAEEAKKLAESGSDIKGRIQKRKEAIREKYKEKKESIKTKAQKYHEEFASLERL
jgi:gas vesicle protein